MIFEFGSYRMDVDVERTRRWYEAAPTVSQCCDCDGCVNYERAADLFPESVKSFFAALGSDMKKPCEVYVNCANRDGTRLWYGGWWHLCGKLLSAQEEKWSVAEGEPFGPGGFRVWFREECVCLPEDFPQSAFELELDADIPWVLEKENTYERDRG